MFSKLSKESKPKHILVISQTNIGDVVLTCPVIDILRRDFPEAKMDVMVGPKAVSLFSENPHIHPKMFNKRAPLSEQFTWFIEIFSKHYDCVVDLRHMLLPLFLMPKYAIPVWFKKSSQGHKRRIHLNRLLQMYNFDTVAQNHAAIITTREDEQFFEKHVAPFLGGKDFVVIAAGAADSAKRWYPQGFAQVADHLPVSKKIIFVGDAKDVAIIEDIQSRMKSPSLSLAGKIGLRTLSLILKKSSWTLTHDSGVMHLASYFNVPLVVLWGPTNINKYAPWSVKSVTVRRNEKCIRCNNHKAKVPHTCMAHIEAEDVIRAIAEIQL